MLNFGLKLGRTGGGANPILQGDYIWYTMDSDTGFLNTNGTRYVNDAGNTVHNVYGTKNGTMYSGRAVVLGDNGQIDLPAGNAYAFVSGTFQSVTSPLTTGTYQGIVVLDGKTFSDDDITTINNDPEALIAWALRLRALPSGIDKTDADKVYPCMELNSDVLLEINYSEGSELVGGIDEFTLAGDDGTNTISLEADGIHFNQVNTDSNVSARLGGVLNETNPFVIVANVTNTVGMLKVDGARDDGSYVGVVFDEPISKRTFFSSSDTLIVYRNATPTEAILHSVSLREITSDFLRISGDYDRDLNTSFGLQTMRFELNDAGVPTNFMQTRLVHFDASGSLVNTGVVVDGSTADFTMMMAFTLPDSDDGEDMYYAWGQTSDNRIQLRYLSGNPLNRLDMQIGKFGTGVDFDTSLPIQAMCAVYNHATSQLQTAINGEPLSAPFDIVFDGATGVVLLGAYSQSGLHPMKGYIGEGILSATMESEEAWFDFWNRVKDATPSTKPDWYKIASLDSADILGAWDFVRDGLRNSNDAKVNLEGPMPSFVNVAGGPGLREGQGIYFGGGGAFGSPLPDGLDINNITTIIQVRDVRQNATLDAFYSHYKSSSHYTLQNGWGSGKIRWSCGTGDSTTIEVGSTVTNGVIATAGRELYVDGTFIDVVPESGEAVTSGDQFVLGGIELDDGRIVQNIIGIVVRVLVVKRILTEAEIQEITSNMTSSTVETLTTDSGEPLTTDDGEELTL